MITMRRHPAPPGATTALSGKTRHKKPAPGLAYVPFRYMVNVKRPGERVIRNKVILNHWIPLTLAISWQSSAPAVHAVAMAFLVAAFWCIYEVGYCENDKVAARYERAPILTRQYLSGGYRVIEWKAWASALTLSTVGIALLEIGNRSPTADYTLTLRFLARHSDSLMPLLTQESIWLGSLVFLRLVYLAYNFADKKSRAWLFMPMQACKFLSFSLVATTDTVGSSLLLGLVIAEWVPYILYRYEGINAYGALPRNWLRTTSFLLVSLAASITTRSPEIFLDPQFLVILAWYLFRSRAELKQAWTHVHPIWKDKLFDS
jgi:hypothetical protein